MKSKNLILAALSGLVIASCSSTDSNSNLNAEEAKGECHGINSCKGKGECGGKGTSCSGTNSCKGKGWTSMTEKDCKAKKGKFKLGGTHG